MNDDASHQGKLDGRDEAEKRDELPADEDENRGEDDNEEPEDGADDVEEPPLSEEEYEEMVKRLVDGGAPRVFAVFQDYGERVDGEVAAWGMQFEDHVQLVTADSASLMHLRSAQRAVRGFTHEPWVTARLIWPTPTRPHGDAATT